MAVNLNRLHEISGGDLEFEREILQAFVEDAWISINILKECFTTQDYSAFTNQAHQLKGSSANMGLTALHTIATELNRKGIEENLTHAEQEIESIEKIIKELEDYIAQT
jgi:histidine phosphotransfer protein HptB